MAEDGALSELEQFLNKDSRLDLKTIALEHLLGLSASLNGIDSLLKNENIIKLVINLLGDENATIRKDTLLLLINLSAETHGAQGILDSKNDNLLNKIRNHGDLISTLLNFSLDSENKDADASCMALCNLTRQENHIENCIDFIYRDMSNIVKAFCDVEYNKKGSKLHYIGPLLSNLSVSSKVKEWLCHGEAVAPIIKVLPFCYYEGSIVRRGGAVGTIRNICFHIEEHQWLLSSQVDLLSFLLLPLVGPEDYPDDEMDMLPPAIQYMAPDKERESDPDIRKMLLEILGKLCIKKDNRETLRNNGVYYVLREYHKWETDKAALLACENVVDILIRKEEEIGVEDITSVEVPKEYIDKFIKMDNDFINDK